MKESVEDPVTPTAKVYLHSASEQFVHFAVGFEFSIDVDAIREEIKSTFLKQPRFESILVEDEHGVQVWRRTKIQIEKHVLVKNIPVEKESMEVDEFVNEYLSDLAVSCPLDFKKPLWEVHILEKQRCCVFRFHHALGDGISLVSLFLSCCRRVDGPGLRPTTNTNLRNTKGDDSAFRTSKTIAERLWNWIKMLWFNLIFTIQYLLPGMGIKDNSPLRGGAGVELWPRKSATATFSLDDMIVVKKAVNGTLNDVFMGIIMSGFYKYLKINVPKGVLGRIKMTGLMMMNIRKLPGLQFQTSERINRENFRQRRLRANHLIFMTSDPNRRAFNWQEFETLMNSNLGSMWGNLFGVVLFPMRLHKRLGDPLECVKISKRIMDRKKQSWEPYLSYYCRRPLVSLLGIKHTSRMNYDVLSNTTFTCSNIGGIKEEISLAGNPIKFFRLSSSGTPHAIMLHLVSYMGKAELQILVAKDIVPDPEFLANCFQDALLEMKNLVSAIKTLNI